MNIFHFAALSGALFLITGGAHGVTAAPGAHPSIDACGGGQINRDEGARDGRVISKSMERRIESFLQEANMAPGVGITIVKDNRVVFTRGFGFLDLDECETVKPDTRFYLKSTTKSFLGLLAAVMHEEGAVELDAPITNYLPDLDLPAPMNASQVPLRAHFTHTIPYIDSGLQYRTVTFGNIADEDFVSHVNDYSQPRSTKFDYTNFSPMMGAHALARASGSNWRDLMETKIFAPASMTSSFAHVAKAEQKNAAKSYLAQGDGIYAPVVTKRESQMVAAGGSYSTLEDLSRWLIINLNGGALNGKQVFPQRAIEQVQARQVQLDWKFYEFSRFAHGLGIYHADYEGDLLLHHFGGETHVSFMPEHNLGVVVLTNAISGGGYVTHRLAATIYDELLEKEGAASKWGARAQEARNSLARHEKQLTDHVTKLKSEAPSGAPSFAPGELVGLYADGRLGNADISIDGGGNLQMRIGVKVSPLQWVGGDGYLVDTGIWNEEPTLWIFRRDKDAGALIIDWGGRIFVRQ